MSILAFFRRPPSAPEMHLSNDARCVQLDAVYRAAIERVLPTAKPDDVAGLLHELQALRDVVKLMGIDPARVAATRDDGSHFWWATMFSAVEPNRERLRSKFSERTVEGCMGAWESLRRQGEPRGARVGE